MASPARGQSPRRELPEKTGHQANPRPRPQREARASPAGAAALAQWAEAHKTDLRVVAQRRDIDGPMVDRALAIVRQFIIDRGLILFGGLAIDYALRLRGAHIYPDDERPDFDFLSPRSVEDAYDLAERLQRTGFEGVGAIRAIHVQTMRVRTSFITVADVGYAPREVFDRLPTVDYQGMRVIHPGFQKMDQLLAFCFPFNGPPREDVFHRWRKDLERFNICDRHYPIVLADAAPAPLKKVSGVSAAPLVGGRLGLTVALHGFAAYSVLRRALDELAAAFGTTALVDAPQLALSFPTNLSFELETPLGGVVVVSPNPSDVVAGLSEPRWYDPYMDLVPLTVKTGRLTVFSTQGRLIGATAVNATPLIRYAAPPSDAQLLTVTPQYLLVYFLAKAHRTGDPNKQNTYLAYYTHAMTVIRRAEEIFADALGAAERDTERKELMDLFAGSPFAPTVQTLGTINHDAAYQIRMATAAGKLHDEPPAVLGLAGGVAGLLAGLPQNYYPGGGKPRPTFDYGANALFRRTGSLRAPGP